MKRRWATILGLLLASGLAGAAWAASSATQAADDLINRLLKVDSAAPAAKPPAARPAPAKPVPGQLPVVMGVRIGEHADRTRFVVEISDPMTMRTFTLRNPNRVVVDMPAVQWHLDGAPRPSGNGSVHAYRYGQFRSGNSRFVIDLNAPGGGDRPARDPAQRRLWLPRRDRSSAHHAGQVRQDRRLARRPEGPRSRRRTARLAAAGALGRAYAGGETRRGDRSRPWRHRFGNQRRQRPDGEGPRAGRGVAAGARACPPRQLHRPSHARFRHLHSADRAHAHRAVLARRPVHLAARRFEPRCRM